MELYISRRAMTNILGIALLAGLFIGGYFAWSSSRLDLWFQPHQTPSVLYGNEPALKSLAAMYSPTGERSEWLMTVCKGMTTKGCELFRSMYANVVWSSSLANSGAAVSFLSTADQFENGLQVWKVEVKNGSTVSPVYILVKENDTDNWFLERVLFEQETTKYKNQ